MHSKMNVLVFPCGSEVGLEIFRSIEHSTHINLLGGSSTDDHGKFVFKNYIGDLPFIDDINFIPLMKEVVSKFKIDAIFPAMDSVITILKKNEKELNCKIIASELDTCEICLSKSKTYQYLKDMVPTPTIYPEKDAITVFPVFLKPAIGYGSRGVKKAINKKELHNYMELNPDLIIMEFLPGKEYTIDCFTNFRGELLFVGPRERRRISNGISVNTSTTISTKRITEFAQVINSAIKFNGAWFFQVKERANGDIVLMEIASRMAGSSSAYRAKGVNLALLSLFNAFEMPIEILANNYDVELDRALYNKYKINIDFTSVYIDFDDTIIIDGKVNTKLVSAIYHFINLGKKVILITKHEFPIAETLKKYRLYQIFDEVLHLKKGDSKWEYVINQDSIFIDDSFAERKEIFKNKGIPVFSVDMIECLIS